MEQDRAKGTLTSLASMFPLDEAPKAVKRVEEAIAQKQKDVERINDFITDNSNLINLVSKLPDELHHDIMVPFGKAAFFPGHLMHTNEFLVLLGEGYYAERTAKQTVEILKRRGKALESQVQSLNANIKDLKAEASFFGTTASEAAEGLVEIREDYVEEDADEKHLKSDDKSVIVEDDEYASMMARLDELEEEELAAGGGDETNVDDRSNTDESEEENDEYEKSTVDESDKENNDGGSKIYVDGSGNVEPTNVVEGDDDISLYRKVNAKFNQTYSEIKEPLAKEKIGPTTSETLSNKCQHQLDIRDHSNAYASPILESTGNISRSSQDQTATSSESSKQGFDSSKAFTGSIVERTHNIQTTSQEKTTAPSVSTNSQPSKPISRFRLQRR